MKKIMLIILIFLTSVPIYSYDEKFERSYLADKIGHQFKIKNYAGVADIIQDSRCYLRIEHFNFDSTGFIDFQINFSKKVSFAIYSPLGFILLRDGDGASLEEFDVTEVTEDSLGESHKIAKKKLKSFKIHFMYKSEGIELFTRLLNYNLYCQKNIQYD